VKLPLDRHDQFLKALKQDTVEDALGAAGVSLLELADGWEPNDKGVPLMAFIDETSMTEDEHVRHIIEACDAVAMAGDLAQLPPVDPDKEKRGEKVISGLEYAHALPDAINCEFSTNYRLRSDAPVLVEVMDHLRRASTDPQADARDELVQAWKLLTTGGGGVTLVRELSPEHVEGVVTGRDVGLVWRNDRRHELTDRIRRLLGFNNVTVAPGEPVLPTINRRNNQKVVELVQRNAAWRFITSDQFFDTCFADTWPGGEDVAQRVFECQYCFEWRADKAYNRLGNYSVADVKFAFGYWRTVHKSQGRQWPTVFIDGTDAYARVSSGLRPGRGVASVRDAARWLYTAVSRAQQGVVLFKTLPDTLPDATAAVLRDQLADMVSGMAPESANF